MKKFKHLPTGVIYKTKDSNSYICEMEIIIIPNYIVEEGKDWEEIKENYKIIKVKLRDNTLVAFDEEGKAIYRSDKLRIESTVSLDKIMNHENLVIFQIKRLTDNQIFTIGDETNLGIIEKFDIIENFLQILTHDGWYTSLNSIKKTPKALFKTTNGVSIFLRSCKLYCLSVDFELFEKEAVSINPLTTYTFLTELEREEFIIMNKPCLSINEVAKIYVTANRYNLNDPQNSPKQALELRNLVKNKL